MTERLDYGRMCDAFTERSMSLLRKNPTGPHCRNERWLKLVKNYSEQHCRMNKLAQHRGGKNPNEIKNIKQNKKKGTGKQVGERTDSRQISKCTFCEEVFKANKRKNERKEDTGAKNLTCNIVKHVAVKTKTRGESKLKGEEKRKNGVRTEECKRKTANYQSIPLSTGNQTQQCRGRLGGSATRPANELLFALFCLQCHI